MESPDMPWAKGQDVGIKKPILGRPTSAAKKLFEFLSKNGIYNGKIAICTSGTDAVLFAGSFEVHHISKSSDGFDPLRSYGIKPHCFDLSDYWLFEDAFFDFVVCTGYYEELKRVVKKDGLVSISGLPGRLPDGLQQISNSGLYKLI